jgi:hypothetical protein
MSLNTNIIEFQFYGAFEFHEMATTSIEPSLPSSLPSSSDGEAIGLATALRTIGLEHKLAEK